LTFIISTDISNHFPSIENRLSRRIAPRKDYLFKKKKSKEDPATKEPAPDLETIISEESSYYGMNPSTLKAVRCGIKNEARDVAIYLI
jgi:hypothetical protein